MIEVTLRALDGKTYQFQYIPPEPVPNVLERLGEALV
jgi:hypothetical protein